jgi:hypothetical protein
MKTLAVIVLVPLLSVVILSLYGMGGAARVAGLVLLGASLAGLLFTLARGRRVPTQDQ